MRVSEWAGPQLSEIQLKFMNLLPQGGPGIYPTPRVRQATGREGSFKGWLDERSERVVVLFHRSKYTHTHKHTHTHTHTHTDTDTDTDTHTHTSACKHTLSALAFPTERTRAARGVRAAAANVDIRTFLDIRTFPSLLFSCCCSVPRIGWFSACRVVSSSSEGSVYAMCYVKSACRLWDYGV